VQSHFVKTTCGRKKDKRKKKHPHIPGPNRREKVLLKRQKSAGQKKGQKGIAKNEKKKVKTL